MKFTTVFMISIICICFVPHVFAQHETETSQDQDSDSAIIELERLINCLALAKTIEYYIDTTCNYQLLYKQSYYTSGRSNFIIPNSFPLLDTTVKHKRVSRISRSYPERNSIAYRDSFLTAQDLIKKYSIGFYTLDSSKRKKYESLNKNREQSGTYKLPIMYDSYYLVLEVNFRRISHDSRGPVINNSSQRYFFKCIEKI